MLDLALAYLAGAATTLLIAVTLGFRWRRKRRRVDEAHAAMLLAVWDAQDTANNALVGLTYPGETRGTDDERLEAWQMAKHARNTAARRYFAAVGEG